MFSKLDTRRQLLEKYFYLTEEQFFLGQPVLGALLTNTLGQTTTSSSIVI